MLIAYAIVFGATFTSSVFLTWLAIRLAPRVGLVDAPGARKIHSTPVPLGGGMAIILSVGTAIGGIVVAAAFFRSHPLIAGLDPRIPDYLGGIFLVWKRLAIVAAGAVALMVMGLIDDTRGLGAWTKLFVQLAVAGTLAASGMRVSVFLPWSAAGWIITIGWLVFVMNSFNLLDNMDGLSGGVALVIAGVFCVVALETGHVHSATVLLVTGAAILGFLAFNFPPARIFMGDTGSYFLGYMLGVSAVAFTFVPEGTTGPTLLPVVLPFILFAIPFYDTLSVIYIRICEGRHPFDADKRHFSHRLTDLGLSTRETVLTIYMATLATAFPAMYLYETGTFAMIGAVVQAFLVLMLVAVLEHAGARKKK